MGTEKNKYGIRFHLSLTYHVIARMRNAMHILPINMTILGPLNISGTVKVRHLTFGTHIEHNKYYPPQDILSPKVGVVRVT